MRRKSPYFSKGTTKDIAFKLLEKGEKLLDLGCGKGDFAEVVKISGLYTEVFGLDVDCNCLKETEERGVIVKRCDLNKGKLPFESNYFDAVTCLEVIEHIINPYGILREVNRILKPRGMFVISTPNIQWIYHILRLIAGYGPRTSFPDRTSLRYHGSQSYDCGHVRYFTKRDLCSLLISSGFIIARIQWTYNVSSSVVKRLITISIKFPILKLFVSPGIVLKARKTRQEEDMLC